MEKIISIEEKSFQHEGSYSFLDERKYDYDGFVITTESQTIYLGIDNDQQCCENWGYLMSEDDLNEFVGANLLDIKVTDTALKTHLVPKLYDGAAMFVDLITDRGPLQFVAYNEHNGYYGHDAVVVSKQFIHSERL